MKRKRANKQKTMCISINVCLYILLTFALEESLPATEASDELKEQQSESKDTNNSAENDENAKDEAPAALIEASSEQPRGLGL